MVKTKDYSEVFRAYDLRGEYPKQIDKKFAYELGKAFVEFTKAKLVAVGFDGRSSAKSLFEGLTKGLMEQGADVVNLGLISTPQCYFSMNQDKYDAGIMITASHEPKNFNGFKLMSKKAKPIFSENGSLEILELIKESNYSSVKKKGKMKKKDWSKEYAKFLLSKFTSNKKSLSKISELSVVIDQSNGSGVVEVEVLKKVLKNVKILNGRVSGTFPGHNPDTTKPENRKKLVSEVKKSKADLGIMFDGDADRVAFIDELGNFIRPDIILNVFSEDLKKDSTIVYDTRSSMSIKDFCEKRGLRGIMSKAGRTYIHEVMIKEKAEIAAEDSGHFFFKEFCYMDSGGLAAIRLLNKLLASDESLSELAGKNTLYCHSGELNFKVKNQSKAFLLVEQAFYDAKKSLFIDGISVYYDNFWFNVRKSNTEDRIIRINAEANEDETLQDVLKKLNNIMALAK